MANTDQSNDSKAELSELRTRAENAEAQNRDLEETVQTLNSIIGHYQQLHADAVLSTATLTAKLQMAQRRLQQSAGAE